MSKALRAIALASIISTNSVFAGDAGGWYVGLDAGGNLQRDLNIGVPRYQYFPPPALRAKFDPGVRLDLDAGFGFNKYFAIELDSGVIFNTSSSTLTTVTGNLAPLRDSRLYQVPIVANLIFNLPVVGNWSAYIGAGVGGVYTRFEGGRVDSFTSGSPTDFEPGYQGMAGFKYELNRRCEIGIGYKTLETSCHHSFRYLGPVGSLLSQSLSATLTYHF